MESFLSWFIPLAVTLAVVALARRHQLKARARGIGDLPASPYFTIPDDTAPAGSRNARLVLTTWDIVKANFAEAMLKGSGMTVSVTETSMYSGDVVRGGPVYQLFVLDEAQAPEARRVLRKTLA